MYAVALRPAVGERERSPRLWLRSGVGPTWARGDLGRVAQGLASSTGIKIWWEKGEGGGGGEGGEREETEPHWNVHKV